MNWSINAMGSPFDMNGDGKLDTIEQSLEMMYLSAGSFLLFSLFQHVRQNSAIIIITSVFTNNRWYILHSNPAYLECQERLWVKQMRELLANRLKQCRKETVSYTHLTLPTKA